MKVLKIYVFVLSLLAVACQKEELPKDPVSDSQVISVGNCLNLPKNLRAGDQYVDPYTEGVTYNLRANRNIPLVFNIIESEGGRKIDAVTIEKQIEILNSMFSGTDADFSEYTSTVFQSLAAGDTKLRFYLKKVNRIQSPYGIQLGKSEWFKTSQYGIVPTTPNKCINVYISDKVYDEEGSFFSGYSSIPGVDKSTEGVVVNSLCFYDPAPTNVSIKNNGLSKGKLLGHEIGHLLGLWHTSGMYGDCSSDKVSDTPQNSKEHMGIVYDFIYETCEGESRKILFCNYMEYVYETQRTMFTKGQKNKMLYNFRSGGTHQFLGF
ncbi:M43 family zinc metalloprotease [Flavobacterium sp.]|uniref:M43 family zinc metalloprotease n=1 Tax=Flavobacterium sp. TaxID=239 RepID=UPI003D102B9B